MSLFMDTMESHPIHRANHFEFSRFLGHKFTIEFVYLQDGTRLEYNQMHEQGLGDEEVRGKKTTFLFYDFCSKLVIPHKRDTQTQG